MSNSFNKRLISTKLLLPPKHVFVKELLFFFVFSSMAKSCFGGSGVSKEKLFMRAFNFFRRVLGLWETVKKSAVNENQTAKEKL